MRELRYRIRTLLARLRAGEGAHALADLGETAEHWLKSACAPLPRAFRAPLEQLGGVLGELARSYRPAPSDVPPPPEPQRRSDAPAPPSALVREPAAVLLEAPAHAAPEGQAPAEAAVVGDVPAEATESSAERRDARPEEPGEPPSEPRELTARQDVAVAVGGVPPTLSHAENAQVRSVGAPVRRQTADRAAPASKAGRASAGPAAKAVPDARRAAVRAEAPGSRGPKRKVADAPKRAARSQAIAKPAEKATASGKVQARPAPPKDEVRVSARRSPAKKTTRSEPPAVAPVADSPKRRKSNGKAKERRPAARRARDAKSDKPT